MIHKLYDNQIWVYKYTPSTDEYSRSSLHLFAPKDIARGLAERLSSDGNLFVGIHPHQDNKSVLYDNGEKERWYGRDLLTKYKLVKDECGNPVIRKLEHVWDYGSFIDEIGVDRTNFFANPDITKEILNNYIEMSIVEKEFNQRELLNYFIDCL
jgi:hypothetical protein